MAFVHLHNHTSHSTLDGLQKIPEMVQAAVDDGQTAVAITDHGSLAGAWDLAVECRKQGIKPILGQEIYLALADDTREERSRFDPKTIQVPASDDFDGSDATADTPMRNKSYEHLTLLAATAQGWRNLVSMHNDSERHSFKRKPLFDWNQLRAHSEGLIAGTGCLGGPVAGNLLRGDTEAAERELLTMVDIFGRENVFVEVMYHDIDAENAVISGLVSLAQKHDLLVVATNDCHYTYSDQHELHDAWLCISQKHGSKTVLVTDQNRFRFNGHGFHMRTEAEMRAIFDTIPGCENAVDNSQLIADKVDENVMGDIRVRLPRFDIENMHWTPENDIAPIAATVADDGTWEFESSADALYSLVRDGAVSLYGTPFSDELKARLRHEVDVITSKGFVDYFLTVWDIVEWARSDRGMPTPEHPRGEPGQKKPIIVGSGRGSAPGSCVSYCMGITNIEPLAHNLLFERFLDASRLDFPDIDTDFESARRDEVVRYLEARWGDNSVALIGTQTMSWSKRAVKDMGRVTGRTSLANELTGAMNTSAMAENSPLSRLLDPEDEWGQLNSELQAMVEGNPEAAALITDAQAIEGVAAGVSVHACGAVVGDEPLHELIPLRRYRPKKNDTTTDHWVTQYDPDAVGETGFGLIKLDLLSISNLDVLSHCVDAIEADTGERVDYRHLSFTDERARKVWDMLAEGRTSNVFQLSSSGMTELTMGVGPESFADLSALVALYRPGPMEAGMHEAYARRKRGTEPVSYNRYTKVPEEQEVIANTMNPTLGVLCYQEQLMSLARDIADFSDKEVNLLRKAFSKKRRDLMDSLRERWSEGGQAGFRRDWQDHGNSWATNADGTPVQKEPKVAFSRSTLDELWRTFEGSASYLFNASHSHAYGYLAYQTAWFKANYPAYFGAALLATIPRNNTDRRRRALADLSHDGIAVMPPDVNHSGIETKATGFDTIHLGLGEITGVGSVAEHIVAERANGPFESLADMTNRVRIPTGDESLASRKLPSSAVEALIDAGACDDFGPRLGQLMVAKAPGTPPMDMEFGVIERAARQMNRINTRLDESPLVKLRHQVSQWREPAGRDARPVPLRSIPMVEGSSVVTLGIVTSATEKSIRSGTALFGTMEGSGCEVDFKCWPNSYNGTMPRVGGIYGLTGRTDVYSPPGEDAARLSISAFDIWQGAIDDPCVGAFEYPPTAPLPVIEPETTSDFTLVMNPKASFLANLPVDVRNAIKAHFGNGISAWYQKNRHEGASEVFEAGGVRVKVVCSPELTMDNLAEHTALKHALENL